MNGSNSAEISLADFAETDKQKWRYLQPLAGLRGALGGRKCPIRHESALWPRGQPATWAEGCTNLHPLGAGPTELARRCFKAACC